MDLANLLKHNSTLIVVDISKNRFGQEGVAALIDAVQNNDVILSLEYINTDPGGPTLSKAQEIEDKILQNKLNLLKFAKDIISGKASLIEITPKQLSTLNAQLTVGFFSNEIEFSKTDMETLQAAYNQIKHIHFKSSQISKASTASNSSVASRATSSNSSTQQNSPAITPSSHKTFVEKIELANINSAEKLR